MKYMVSKAKREEREFPRSTKDSDPVSSVKNVNKFQQNLKEGTWYLYPNYLGGGDQDYGRSKPAGGKKLVKCHFNQYARHSGSSL
jgi:hypothetical protein